MYGKIKNGLKNFIFLGFAVIIAIGIAIIYKIYKLIQREYYRNKLSRLSPEAQQSLVESAMLFTFNENPYV